MHVLGDGGQTNATLGKGSARRFLTELHALRVFDGQYNEFKDLGSSYGSLLFMFAQIFQELDANTQVKWVGDEYFPTRHVLGCNAVKQMLNNEAEGDHRILKSRNVELRHRDLFHQSDYGTTTIAFAFDKVFVPELLIYILFSLIYSPNVATFITCKPSFSSLWGSYNFRYGTLLKLIGFEEKGKIEKCKMNGSNEQAGSFYVYQRSGDEAKEKTFGTLVHHLKGTFPSKIDQIEYLLKLREKATNRDLGEKKIAFPKDQNDIDNIRAYYVEHANDYDIFELGERKAKKKKSKMVQSCQLHENMQCPSNLRCVECEKMFPDYYRSSELCYIKRTEDGRGDGLFARHVIEEGTFICQYIGAKSIKAIQGCYVLQIAKDHYVNAEKTKNSFAKYANHSCNGSNIKAVKVRQRCTSSKDDKHIEKVFLVACENILPDMEMTWTYCQDSRSFFDNRLCLCKHCEGSTKPRQPKGN